MLRDEIPGDARRAIVTPEAVALDLDVAGLGSRFAAAAVDFAIQAAIGLGFGLALAGLGAAGTPGTPLAALAAVGFFLILFGYFPLCEGLWSGRTPGKRAAGLRVVQGDGQPLTMGPLLVRNLVRVVDFLPGWYVVGAIAILVSPRSQRLGDLAAGTIVVRERSAPAPSALPAPSPGAAPAPADASALTEREYGMVRSFLQRRGSLDPQARRALAAQIAGALRGRVPGLAEPDDERFIEEVARAYRGR